MTALSAGAPAGGLSLGAPAPLSGEPLTIEGALTPGGQALADAARRANPEVQRAIAASATAYEGLSADAARKLAGEAFPSVVDQPAGGPPKLPQGDGIRRYVGPDAALLSSPGGRTSVLESLSQIAARTADGWQQLDLGLQESGGDAYGAKRSDVAVRLPKDVSQGVSLPGVGVSLTPLEGSGGRAASASSGVVDGYAVFWGGASMGAAIDLIARPSTSGFDLLASIRAQAAPETLRFAVGVPRGATLARSGDGSVEVRDAGRVLARIRPASAWDAEGTRVAGVRTALAGSVLTVTVPHPAGRYRLPILVDPEVEDTIWQNSLYYHTEWHFERSGAGFGTAPAHPENGSWTETISSSHNSNEYGGLFYTTRGVSQIVLSHVEGHWNDTGSHIQNYVLLQTAHGLEDYDALPEATSGGGGYACLPSRGCTETTAGSAAPENSNTAAYEQVATGAGEGHGGENTVTQAYVKVSQESPPTVRFNTESASFWNGKEWVANVLHENGGWLGPKRGAFEVEAKDPGIGIGLYRLWAAGWKDERRFYENGNGECFGIQCPEAVNQVYTYGSTYNTGLADGEDRFEALAEDEAGLYALIWPQTIRVDASSPTNLQVSGLPANGIVSGTYGLTARATDGSGSTPSSGVKSLEVGVDGYAIEGKSASCEPGPCTAVSVWTLHGEEFGAGKHKLELVATDYANNKETRSYEFTVRHPSPISVGPASVDPISGSATLSASDVSIGGGYGALGVTRSFNSSELNGEVGPLGSQWSLSLSGDQGLEEEPTGAVTLIAEDGSATTFESDGKGGFVSPKGDENLVLSAEREGETVKAYLLKDPAKGTTLKFVHPAGAGKEDPWMVETAEGALSKENGEKLSYKWEMLEGVERPKLALAPVPAGVSCEPELKAGCRALSFSYATETKATGEAPSEWGEYKGRLVKVSLTAYNPSSKVMETKAVAEYSYDKQGRLRAEWDPRITPALKTTYGYDAEGRVVAIGPSGQQPWLLHYGAIAGDSIPGRLLSAIRPPASASLGNGPAPVNEVKPTLSTTTPTIGTTLKVASNGSWSNGPLAYAYQWQDCDGKGEKCAAIPGAVNETYTPQAHDAGYTLIATVTAVNADGTGAASTAASGQIALAAPTFSLKFGSLGEGEGQLKAPTGVAIDASGDVWVSDHNNNRLEQFSSSGAFMRAVGWGVANGEAKLQTCTSSCRAGIAGSGAGQLHLPDGIAISGEEVYVADAANSRIEVLNVKGEFVRTIGSGGWETGKLENPVAVAVAPGGNLWIADRGHNRVEEFSTTGTFVGCFGAYGSGNGRFKGPSGIAFSGEYAYVVDSENARVQQLTLSGGYVAQFGSAGTGEGQFSSPGEIATDPVSGDLYVADNGNNRIEAFNPAGAFLASAGGLGEGNGQFKGVEAVAVNSAGGLYAADLNNNRIQKLAPTYSISNPAPEPPNVGSSAAITVDYQVPVSGAGAPYALGSSETAAWAQTDNPIEATAVFPPDEPMGWPAKDYTKATISYLDYLGRTVNVASPSGAISTTEYNETNNVVRTLSGANRVIALNEGAKSAEVAKLLDSQSKYNTQGTELLETLGPQHKVKLANGQEKQARERVQDYYDEGAPTEGGPYRLLTKSTDGATYENTEADVRTTVYSYAGQESLGWKLRKPTSVTTDPNGLKLVQTTVYDPATGNVTETRQPGTEGAAAAPVFQLGAAGAGNGQFKFPAGVAVDSAGHVWVVDTSNDRVQEFSSEGAYIRQFGSEGTGNGQFKFPQGIAVDNAGGHLWVSDSENNRVQEFTLEGGYVAQFGSSGTGNGQFKFPEGIAVDSSGDVWVVDSGNGRVQEFDHHGGYIRQFGSSGTGNGQFRSPWGIVVDNTRGHVWVADSGNDRVQDFTLEGAYIGQFGSEGTGNGQFKGDLGYGLWAALDTRGDLWVTDSGNRRVQEFSPTGEYIRQFGSEGTGNGQFKKPTGVAVDSGGKLWVADTDNNRVQEWMPNSYPSLWAAATTFGTNGTGNGQFKDPEGLAMDSAGHIWVVDKGNNRVQEFSGTGEYIRQFGTLGTGNGQFKGPTGVAVDPYGRGVWVTDSGNNRVQELSTEGVYIRQFGTLGTGNGQFKEPWGIAVNSSGYVWVTDSGNNRVQEFSSEGAYMRQFGSEGTGNGQFKGAWGIAVDSSNNVWVGDPNNLRVQEFSPTGAYLSQFYAGVAYDIAVDRYGYVWLTGFPSEGLREYTSAGGYVRQLGRGSELAGVAVDLYGNLWVAEKDSNVRVQEWARTKNTTSARESQTIYYTAASNSQTPACGAHPEWANLPCRSQPTEEPEQGLMAPVVTDTYNMWDEPEVVKEVFAVREENGSTARTRKSVYDSAGRLTGSEVTSNYGSVTTLPRVEDEYDPNTGAMVKQSTTVGEKTQTITSVYNTLGQLVEYTDADGNKSKYAYDVDGRISEMSDGKGTQTYAYDPTTGALTKLLDTSAGTFTASYDVVGRISSETYPNGMSAKYAYDEAGQATHAEYVKEAHCAGTCPEAWLSEGVAYSIHGEALSRASSLASETYAYDNAGRLTEVQETPVGKGCVVRLYAYDEDSNRVGLTTREPGLEGKCATEGGTVESHAYDEADRIADPGTSYDAFGNTTALPAADAEGHEVKSTYYVSNQTRSTSQNGKTITYSLDPDARSHEITTEEGASKTSVVNHYPGPSGAIAWTDEGAGKYTRNIPGIDGALTAVEQSGSTPVLQLHDLEGNVVATAALSETETKLLSTYNSTEFGVPVNGAPPKYSWLGALGVKTEFASGTTAAGGAGYVPRLGRPLQTQPIEPPGAFGDGTSGAGEVTAAYTGADSEILKGIAIQQEAARQQAAEEEAVRKAEDTGEQPFVDPNEFKWFSRKEAREKASELGEVWTMAALASILGLEGEFIGAVEGVSGWLVEAQMKLEKCANNKWERDGHRLYNICRIEVKIEEGLILPIKSIDFSTPMWVWECKHRGEYRCQHEVFVTKIQLA